ncbi:hypothetical protein Dcae01_00392 [Deinococcus caeni]|uniref:Phosphotyrosine protein phosphatase I domain-containing protein n=1 Tax=Deinococcus caeni TaxID=569127 RepID=A0ABP9U7U9_9DEIO
MGGKACSIRADASGSNTGSGRGAGNPVTFRIVGETNGIRLSPPNAEARVQLMRDFDPLAPGADVPDPYYGGAQGFEEMYDMLERSARTFAAGVAGQSVGNS